METKNVTLRLSVELADYLQSGGLSINQSVVDKVNKLKTLESVSMTELKGVFTPGEWKFFFDSMNGILITDFMRFSKDILIAHNEDAELYNSTAIQYDVDLVVLNTKIKRLSGANIDAIYTRVENYWNTEEADIEKWALY